jgi:flavin reductase (DIM6/NTAB) family NADH-FMN oxidoreductase RutF
VTGSIHTDHPFLDPEDQRDPARRFRGRLSAPVTIVTAATDATPVGLTVSSIVVAGSEAGAMVHFVLGSDSFVRDAIEVSGGFVVHVVDAANRALADRFAGVRPSPGGPFAGVDIAESGYGPVIVTLPNRAGCRLLRIQVDEGSAVVTGAIEQIEVDDLESPLVWFRGSYRTLGP